MNTRVFIVDDDPGVRRGLQRLLKAEGFETRVFASADEYLAQPPETGLGCLLLDINMPGMSGMELQANLARRGDDLPIVFLTGHGDIPMSVQAMKGGAVDFLTKPVDQVDLLGAVRGALAQHRRLRSEASAREVVLSLLATLTPREREVMEVLLTGAPNKVVADRLDIAVKTVKVHRAHVMEKLEVRSVAELVHLCHIAGIY